MVANPAEPDHSVNPLPELAFEGKIGETYKDSEGAWQCRRPGAVCGGHRRALKHQGQLCRAYPDSDTGDAGAR